MWKHIERGKFIDASLLSKPLSKPPQKKWGEICARTLADFSEVCRTRLHATPGKASSVISEPVEKIRSNFDGVTVIDTWGLLAVARSANPIDGFSAYHQATEQGAIN